jgi:hypothetical protein
MSRICPIQHSQNVQASGKVMHEAVPDAVKLTKEDVWYKETNKHTVNNRKR